MDLAASRQEGFVSKHLSDAKTPPKKRPLVVIGVLIGFGRKNNSELIRKAWMSTKIEIYCSPTADSRAVWQPSMTHIVVKGGCFILSANQFCRRKDYPPFPEYEFTGTDEELTPEAIVCAGGNVIISPSGDVLAGSSYDGEALITADLDLGEIAWAKFDFDVVGHYARPELLSLIVLDEPATVVFSHLKITEFKRNN